MGNKSKIAKEIQRYFPKHETYIEPFFGAGGMFFNKPPATHNIVNDIDSDVYNLYQVMGNISEMVELTPIHQRLFNEWAAGKKETAPEMQAVRFLFLSNFSLYGKGDTLRVGAVNTKKILLKNIKKTLKLTQNVQFTNCDFREFFKKMQFKNPETFFCYCDPPYIGTVDNYSHSFSERDTRDLVELLIEREIKFAISEILTPITKKIALDYGLNIQPVTERQTLKSRNTEILITNYPTNILLLF